jgi:sugar-specific transcriptional regulator TrmB
MQLITQLEQIGLSKREAEVYVALLQKKEFTAPELTKITSITRTKVYEHLQNLIHKGFCNESIKNRQKVYKAVNPKIVLKNIVKNYELEMSQKKQVAEILEQELSALHIGNKDNSDPIDYIEVFSDTAQIKEKWLNIQRTTEKELLIFTKQPYLIPLEENIEDESELFTEKKITGRSIYEYNNLTSEQCRNLILLIEKYEKMGEESRLIKELPMKMVVCDEKKTIFALDDKVSMYPSFTLVIIEHPNFATAQKKVFESYWASSITLEEFKKLTGNQ